MQAVTGGCSSYEEPQMLNLEVSPQMALFGSRLYITSSVQLKISVSNSPKNKKCSIGNGGAQEVFWRGTPAGLPARAEVEPQLLQYQPFFLTALHLIIYHPLRGPRALSLHYRSKTTGKAERSTMPTATTPRSPTDPNRGTVAPHLPLHLPPPSTFDFLPPLHSLLVRLILSSPPTVAGSHVAVSPLPLSNGTDQPLSPKDLATAATAVTAKIQKARAAVRAVEGIEMGIEEQEDVIRELEEEVKRGRRVLDDLRERCLAVVTDTEREGSGEQGVGMDVDIDGGVGSNG